MEGGSVPLDGLQFQNPLHFPLAALPVRLHLCPKMVFWCVFQEARHDHSNVILTPKTWRTGPSVLPQLPHTNPSVRRDTDDLPTAPLRRAPHLIPATDMHACEHQSPMN